MMTDDERAMVRDRVTITTRMAHATRYRGDVGPVNQSAD